MNSTLRDLPSSAALSDVPAGGFALFGLAISPATQTNSFAVAYFGLGEPAAYGAIPTDTPTLVATGDQTRAEQRITDLETLWDQNAAALRQADRAAWGAIDAARDHIFNRLHDRGRDNLRGHGSGDDDKGRAETRGMIPHT